MLATFAGSKGFLALGGIFVYMLYSHLLGRRCIVWFFPCEYVFAKCHIYDPFVDIFITAAIIISYSKPHFVMYCIFDDVHLSEDGLEVKR